jgi:hypothetical protein
MLESEIQSLVSFIFSRCQVLQPLCLGHRIPFVLSHFIAPDVVTLDSKVQRDIDDVDSEENPITALVTRCVICQFC